MQEHTRGRIGSVGLALAGVGGVLLLVSTQYLWRRSAEFPEAVVVECRVYDSHGTKWDVSLKGGRRLTLDVQDLDDARQCPARVEKRRGEPGYRLDGQLRGRLFARTMKQLGALGISLLSGGAVALWIATRR